MPQRFASIALRTLCLAALGAMAGCSSHAVQQEAPSSMVGTSATAEAAKSGKAHVAAGRDFLRRGNLEAAEREFRQALEADANDLEAIAGLGQVEVARGQYSEGVAHLERATRVPSQMVAALRSLGDAYAATGDVTRAATAYRQAVALAPADIDLRLALARSLTEIGEYGEAKSVCADAIRLAKGNPTTLAQAYRQLGEVCSREGSTPEAFAALYKAAELDPRDTGIAKSLATCAVRAGLYAEAATAYARVLKLAPLDVDAKKQLAWVNFKLDRFPVAIKHYEAVGDSLGTVDRYYLAQAYAKSNRADRAVELFRDVVRIDPENYKGVYCNMAYAYYEASRYQRAIEAAREGLSKDSSSACLHFCWAQALDKLGRHEEAIPVFETVLNDPAYSESAKRELERQKRIVRLLKSKEKSGD
jgi:tetratricopeptide (TPR) repeat protein